MTASYPRRASLLAAKGEGRRRHRAHAKHRGCRKRLCIQILSVSVLFHDEFLSRFWYSMLRGSAIV